MRKQSLFIAAGSLLFAISFAHADEVKVTEESANGGTVYRLQNYRVNLLIDPARGGAVVSYKDKLGGNIELIQQAKYGGLCQDHFQAQPWPGELLEVPYEATVIKESPEECIVQVSRKSTGAFMGEYYPDLNGVLLEKQYSLKAGSPSLECRVKLTASAKTSSTLAYWSQNVFWAGGTYDAENDWSYRPSTRGVRAKSREKPGLTGTEDFLNDFNAGWMAIIDKKSKSGLAILADYNDLQSLYVNNGNLTAELMFNVTYLPPGSSTEFTTKIIPVFGLDNVITANEYFIAGCKVTSDNRGAGNLTMDFVRSVNAPENLSLDVTVKSLASSEAATQVGNLKMDSIGDNVKSGFVKFSGVGPDPLIIGAQGQAATVGGDDDKIAFEDFFPGAYRWGENINTDMSSPVYNGVRPIQKIKLQRPSNLALRNPGKSNVWFIDGLLDDYYKINDAVNLVALNDSDLTKKSSFTIDAKAFGNKLTFFPYDYEELLSFNYIIVGGAKADAVGPVGMEMLADFQKAGGGIIMLGGPEAYAKSGFEGTRVEDLLPVQIQKAGFDLADVKGAEISVEENLPMFQDLDWRGSPRVRYLHDVQVKSWGKVVLTADGKPFLVIGETRDKARVACFLGAPMGTMQNGQGVPFWKWNDWPYLMRQVVWWVTRQDQKFTLHIN